MNQLDWNRERYRTRDRLLDFTTSMLPPHLEQEGPSLVYPYANVNLAMLEQEILAIAESYGFEGNMDALWNRLLSISGIVRDIVTNFPEIGEPNVFYLDTESDILYYYKQTTSQVDPATAEENGIYIAGFDEQTGTTYLYIPVRAMLIEDSILNGGNSN